MNGGEPADFEEAGFAVIIRLRSAETGHIKLNDLVAHLTEKCRLDVPTALNYICQMDFVEKSRIMRTGELICMLIEDRLPPDRDDSKPIKLFQYAFEGGGGSVFRLPDGSFASSGSSMHVEPEEDWNSWEERFSSLEEWWDSISGISGFWAGVHPIFVHGDIKAFLYEKVLEVDEIAEHHRSRWMRKLRHLGG